tara:strand:+ start:1179 stop:1370 length:192 start_codon:yes stop_codon:yes gene_type:complete
MVILVNMGVSKQLSLPTLHNYRNNRYVFYFIDNLDVEKIPPDWLPHPIELGVSVLSSGKVLLW